MNNFGSENMGVLLHKLTKYQTLLANCGTPSKSAIYNQKIDYYSNKLNNMGVSQNNLKNMRNLIGGVDVSDVDANANIKALEALLNAPPPKPVEFKDPNESILNTISIEFDEVMKLHEANKENLAKLQSEKTLLEQKNTELTNQIGEKTKEIKQKTEEITQLTSERDTTKKDLEEKVKELDSKVTELAKLTTEKEELEKTLKEKQQLINEQNEVITLCRQRLSTPSIAVPPSTNPQAEALLQRIQDAKKEMKQAAQKSE